MNAGSRRSLGWQSLAVLAAVMTASGVFLRHQRTPLTADELALGGAQIGSIAREAEWAAEAARNRSLSTGFLREHLRQLREKASGISDDVARRHTPPALQAQRASLLKDAASVTDQLDRAAERVPADD